MKLAICSIAYNESEIIKAHINNWKGKVDKHLVLVSNLPWNGSPTEYDGTIEIARQAGAEVINRYWETEQEQRNWGLAYLYDYDYILIIDPDEFYTEQDQKILLNRLHNPLDHINRSNRRIPTFTAKEIITYWKTTDYILEPKDLGTPIIAIDPKQVRFSDKRACRMKSSGDGYVDISEPLDIKIHHISWVKSDKKVKEKIEAYAHANDFNTDWWYENIWLKWTPGCDLKVRPYGVEKSIAIYKPIPEELSKLIKS